MEKSRVSKFSQILHCAPPTYQNFGLCLTDVANQKYRAELHFRPLINPSFAMQLCQGDNSLLFYYYSISYTEKLDQRNSATKCCREIFAAFIIFSLLHIIILILGTEMIHDTKHICYELYPFENAISFKFSIKGIQSSLLGTVDFARKVLSAFVLPPMVIDRSK